MKKIYGLLVLATFAIMMHAGARTQHDKTFLMPRSHNENLAMEYTTWHKTWEKTDEKGYGGTIQAVGFYQESENEKALGNYFGAYNNATSNAVTNPYSGQIMDYIWVAERPPLSLTNNEQALLLESRHIIHDQIGDVSTRLHVKAQMRPESESYGVRLDYYQNLDKILKRAFLKVTVPIVHVQNNMNVSYTGTVLTQAMPNNQATGATGSAVSLADYLAGRIYNPGSGENKQEALTAAKIDGSRSRTGVADVDVTFGYNFIKAEHHRWSLQACLSVPTGNKPRGTYLFEPVIGAGKHWALGGGTDATIDIWESNSWLVQLLIGLNYKYRFQSTETRTLSFKYDDSISQATTIGTAGQRVPYGFYFLGGENGKYGVFPLANVLNRDVGVLPGSMVEGMLAFSLNFNKFVFDVGYNLFHKEGERVKLKDWPDNTYAIAAQGYSADIATGNTFRPTNINDAFDGSGVGAGTLTPIQREHLLPSTVESPACTTHKIFGGLGACFDFWKFPLMIGGGASYEFLQRSNTGLEGYAFWGKLGVTF